MAVGWNWDLRLKLELSNIFQQSTFAEGNQKPSHLKPSLHGDAREDKVLIIDNVQVGPVMLCSPGGTKSHVLNYHMFDHQWCFVQDVFAQHIFGSCGKLSSSRVCDIHRLFH